MSCPEEVFSKGVKTIQPLCAPPRSWSFFSLFFLETETDSKGGGAGAEGETENPQQPPRPAWSPTQGSVSQPCDHDPSQNQALDALAD